MKQYRVAMVKLANEIRFAFPADIAIALHNAEELFEKLYREHKFTRSQVLRTMNYFCKVSKFAHGQF